MTALLVILTGVLVLFGLTLLARAPAPRRTRTADACGEAADSGWFASFDGGGTDCSGADGGGCDGGGGD